MTETLQGEKQFYTLERLPRPWHAAAKMLSDAEMAHRRNSNSPWLIHRIEERISAVREELRWMMYSQCRSAVSGAPITPLRCNSTAADRLSGFVCAR